MRKYGVYLLSVLAILITACDKNEKTIDDNSTDPPAIKPELPVKQKKVYVWVDAEANLSKFTTISSIKSYMKKIKDAGIDGIYLNVKPGIGYALYKSDVLPRLTKWGNFNYNVDFDYLEEFLRIGEEYNIEVYAAIDAVGYGVVKYRQGLVYEDSSFDGVTQVRMLGNNPNNLEDMRNRPDAVAANLSLIHPKAQNLLITVCTELVTKYPKLKGICLDVCRFENVHYCMSDYSVQAFAEYIGEPYVDRNDLITAGGGQGPLFNKWIEFRTRTITNLVKKVRETVDNINPDLDFHFWSGGQWSSRYEVGQNWASVNYTLPVGPYTKEYQSLGFAHLVDAVVPGSYTSKVWESDGAWSVEYHVKTYADIVRGDTKVINSITVYSYADSKDLQDAMYLSLKYTDGLMLFDLCHICEFSYWDAVTVAIKKYAY